MTIKENPFAFACTGNPHEDVIQEGMTLLDYFAGQALQSLISNSTAYVRTPSNPVIVRDSYEIANLMLEERKKYLQT